MNTIKKSGILISVEGIDGSGKSTLVHYLAAWLQKRGHQALATKQPGGTRFGVLLREILQNKPVNFVPRAEYLLFAADRAQHSAEIVIPALQAGTIVISDRMADSSLAYQGYGKGENLEMIDRINRWAMSDVEPHLIFYLRIDPQEALRRILERGSVTAFEKEQLPFMKKVVAGFDEIFRNRTVVVTIDAAVSLQEVNDIAIKAVIQRLAL